ncbi:unnamed protein product [Arctogadus glacialis]
MLGFVTLNEASQLLHNKFVVILGGSVQRSMYKDLVLLLQKDTFLTSSQLKSKGEASFEHDGLVEGGSLGPLSNGPGYREVRQYRSEHHLVRYYFLSRVYSPYMESILEDLRGGLKPDLLVVNSSVCDMSSYRCSRDWLPQYHGNLHKFFEQLKTVTTDTCIRVWILNTTGHLKLCLQGTAMEANLCSGTLARAYGLDVLDLHYHFRCLLQHRRPHGVPWDGRSQRRASTLLLHHVAAAWGVKMSTRPLLGLRPASRAIRGPAGPASECLRVEEGTGTVGSGRGLGRWAGARRGLGRWAGARRGLGRWAGARRGLGRWAGAWGGDWEGGLGLGGDWEGGLGHGEGTGKVGWGLGRGLGRWAGAWGGDWDWEGGLGLGRGLGRWAGAWGGDWDWEGGLGLGEGTGKVGWGLGRGLGRWAGAWGGDWEGGLGLGEGTGKVGWGSEGTGKVGWGLGRGLGRKRRPTPSLFLAEITCDEEAGRVSLAAGQSAPLSTPSLEGQTQAPPSTPSLEGQTQATVSAPSLEGPAPLATVSAPTLEGPAPLATVSPPTLEGPAPLATVSATYLAGHAPLATLPPTYLAGQAPPSPPSLEGRAPKATLSAPNLAGRTLATVSPPSPADHAPLATLPPTYLEGQAPLSPPSLEGQAHAPWGLLVSHTPHNRPITLGAVGEPHPSQQTHNPGGSR